MPSNYKFFLGGYDLEMVAIREFLSFIGTGFYDKKLGWGAKASAYKSEIAEVTSQGKIPVLVELEVDIELPASTIVIDHHGDRSAEKASLTQVIEFFGRRPTREDKLIAANDSGYIPAMQAMGATQAEIDSIRLRDRQAQGVTPEMERQAEEAIAKKTTFPDGVVMVEIPHTKCSTVTDRLFPTWPNGKENLLVVCFLMYDNGPTEVHYFGRGDRCRAIKEKFAPNSWGGGKGYGDPNKNAFAGFRTYDVDRVYLDIMYL